jgi:hypothetical protein
VDVFHHHLEAVEASCLGYLHFIAEALSKVLDHNAIRCSEEGKNIFNEVLFVLTEFLPIFDILTEIDLIWSPKASHLFFVHLPDIVVLNG